MLPTRMAILLLASSLPNSLAEQVADTKISVDSGFYEEAIEITLSTATEAAFIVYTSDGTEPSLGNIFNPINGTRYESPITIASTTVLRVRAFSEAELDPTNTDTRTYFFLDDVIRQPADIDGWPRPNLSIGQGTAQHDYEMDPRIVGDGEAMKQALLAIPTMSLVVEPDKIWNKSGAGGFYRGDNEEAVDIEILYPDAPSKREHARGIVQGHSHDRLKRSLRLKFKAEAGDSKLRTSLFRQAPLHAEGAPQTFDRLILRAGNNRSWARSWNPDRTAYTMDEWYRATQIEASGYGARGAFVHLYLNGLYWGLYNVTERLDRWFSTEHFGGEVEDWFAISHGGDQGGDKERWRALLDDAEEDLSDPVNYRAVTDKLDVPGMIDYLLITWYLNVTDWPNNNWWASMQNEPAGVARFLAWDGEWSFGLGASPGMAWVHPDFTKNKRSSNVPVAKLWLAARENADFMALVADRAHQLLEAEGGALTDARARARWQSLNAHVKEAVLAESARWGDAVSPGNPRTVDEDWQHEVERIDELLGGNAALLIDALREQDYYPDLDPPSIAPEDGPIVEGEKISIANPNSKGKLYITTDGTDPRSPGGTLAATAMETTDPVELIVSTRIKSRVRVASIFGGQTWSALTERAFYTDIPQLRISEIMYHPADPSEAEIESGFTNDDDFEYLVLTNPTAHTIELKGMRFTDGIQFMVEDATPLAPGDHAVIVRNAEAFAHRYGSPMRILGTYTRALSNGGERLAIAGAFDEPILDFNYRDDWHEATDGDGSALLLTNLNIPDKAESWQPTAPFQMGSTPNRLRLSLQQISPTEFALTLVGEPTTAYELEVSLDLEQWTSDRQMNTTEQATATTTVATDIEETQFYRVRPIAQ